MSSILGFMLKDDGTIRIRNYTYSPAAINPHTGIPPAPLDLAGIVVGSFDWEVIVIPPIWNYIVTILGNGAPQNPTGPIKLQPDAPGGQGTPNVEVFAYPRETLAGQIGPLDMSIPGLPPVP